ncbi:bifunctional glutamate N-acetyltransferase/amino-acid acetyltransferase ArgJ [Parvibaculum sedimenti]|uniref:Arginine biosynthesis bifunctional protein ArgJ n=1 Tax=Parvibaculum sedimenti TaxID=2608632 RepID=A0A6N6VEP1_9HYPH|nr:bifunctional glutamate N-acetyltransferase/amino-acid acetyltransferase ArgJ [Parvibaculum sedimenti]KAB7738699.1 bifunctional glutamate N-acetyltransferase/amino-acid acetyltransferase ArgJ [Parvibaculum sedimenti]
MAKAPKKTLKAKPAAKAKVVRKPAKKAVAKAAPKAKATKAPARKPAAKKVAVKKVAVKKAAPKKAVAKKTAHKVSPLAPKSYAKLPPLAGVSLGTAAAGIKYKGRDDVLVISLPEGTAAAGVFTTSKTASAPVEWCRAGIAKGGKGRVVVVNSGNSNAFTGKAGVATVEATVMEAAAAVGCDEDEVYVASTGVIGQALNPSPLLSGIHMALNAAGPDQWDKAARAIMTTDTYPKLSTRKARIGDATVTINGIGKGSGMIAPDLATMLVFIVTDAAIAPAALQSLLAEGSDRSFNAITVDSDTSTSDTVLLFATGTAKGARPVKRAGDPALAEFRKALDELLLDLAHQVVKDGEGASKFIRIDVSGAENEKAARRIGLAIANSPLVKTAIAGEDANWGRVVMAVGKSGEAADRDRLSIRMGGVDVAKNGVAVPGYDETPVARHMKGQDIDIEVDVGVGKGRATVWTCDLTYEYIRINADYRS